MQDAGFHPAGRVHSVDLHTRTSVSPNDTDNMCDVAEDVCASQGGVLDDVGRENTPLDSNVCVMRMCLIAC